MIFKMYLEPKTQLTFPAALLGVCAASCRERTVTSSLLFCASFCLVSENFKPHFQLKHMSLVAMGQRDILSMYMSTCDASFRTDVAFGRLEWKFFLLGRGEVHLWTFPCYASEYRSGKRVTCIESPLCADVNAD